MRANLCRGLFLATLAIAAASTECDSSAQGDCAVDEHLSSTKEELHGLELLQRELKLTNELVSTPAVPEVASPKSLKAREVAPTLLEVEVRATNSVADGSSSGETEKVVTFKEQKIDADSLDDSAMSLVETTAVVHRRSTHYSQAMAMFVAGLRVQGGSAIVIVIILVILLSILSFFLFPAFFGGAKSVPGASASSATSAAPSAQVLLQAPRSTTTMQSPIMTQALGSGAVSTGSVATSAELPPICPSLILPHTEARFMIPIESLMRASGELDIRGTSGRKLLHGSVSETPEGRRCLALASVGCEEDPRVTVMASRSTEQGPLSGGAPQGISTMELYGKGGKFYGTLEGAPGGGAILRCEGQAVMSLEIGGGDLRMTASSMDGRLLASAGKNVQVAVRRLESHDTWKLQVKPGFDAVLIAACMLGALLFSQ